MPQYPNPKLPMQGLLSGAKTIQAAPPGDVDPKEIMRGEVNLPGGLGIPMWDEERYLQEAGGSGLDYLGSRLGMKNAGGTSQALSSAMRRPQLQDLITDSSELGPGAGKMNLRQAKSGLGQRGPHPMEPPSTLDTIIQALADAYHSALK
jgi:hypothetical protein